MFIVNSCKNSIIYYIHFFLARSLPSIFHDLEFDGTKTNAFGLSVFGFSLQMYYLRCSLYTIFIFAKSFYKRFSSAIMSMFFYGIRRTRILLKKRKNIIYLYCIFSVFYFCETDFFGILRFAENFTYCEKH